MITFIEINVLCIDKMHNNKNHKRIFEIVKSFNQINAFEIVYFRMQNCDVNVQKFDDNFSKKKRTKKYFCIEKTFAIFFENQKTKHMCEFYLKCI